MNKINWNRVLLGGLLAGVIINCFEFVVNGILLMKDWEQAMVALNRPTEAGAAQMVIYIIWGFVIGFFAIWLYAAIRPRYGAGPKTAACAAGVIWFLAYFPAMLPMITMELFPPKLIWVGLSVGLVEMSVATLAGACLYKEQEAAVRSGI